MRETIEQIEGLSTENLDHFLYYLTPKKIRHSKRNCTKCKRQRNAMKRAQTAWRNYCEGKFANPTSYSYPHDSSPLFPKENEPQ